MKSRGEESLKKFPKLGAKIYDKLNNIKSVQIQINEIAQELTKELKSGRLLDIGTGPGRLLLKINGINPNIELYGVDISKRMLEQAKKNLTNIVVNLQLSSIQETPYENNYFDLITCTGSFYLWDQPIECLNEIYRILKPGKTAILYETTKDYDSEHFKTAVKDNLKNSSFFQRKISPYFLKKQLKMTYHVKEIANIIEQTKFNNDYKLEMISLSNLPIWLRITLKK